MKLQAVRFFYLATIALLLLAETVVRAGTLTGSFSPIAAGSNVDLTMVGKLDWVHWGLYTDSSIDRKAGVTPLISNFTVIGSSNDFLAAYRYTDNSNSYTWYDGQPRTTITNTTTGVWAYQASAGGSFPLGSGFQLTVPADTTQKTLQVFVGAFAARGQLTASLSDGSAAQFISSPVQTVNNQSNGPGGVFTIDFTADSGGQTLTVQWVVAQVAPEYPLSGNVTLQAAAMTATGADNPPFALLNDPTNDAAFAAPANITFDGTAQDFDGTVTNIEFYANGDKLGETNVSPFTFTWSNAPVGHYFLTAVATDNAGVSRSSTPAEVFVYGNGGSETGSVADSPATVDLTAEGTADWIHWGLTNAASIDYQSNAVRKISGFTVLGTNAVQQYSDNFTAFSWSDGIPDVSVSGTTTGVFITGATNGFELTSLADTNSRTLRIYAGLYGAQGRFQAYLSDLSAPPFTDMSVSNVYGNSYVVYTITYAAASPGQTLKVVYNTANLFDSVYGNVTLQAATLQGGPADLFPAYLLSPQYDGSNFIFSVTTQTNHNYTVEYTDSLNPTAWQILTNFSGDGTTVNVTNQDATAAQRFYRVVAQ